MLLTASQLAKLTTVTVVNISLFRLLGAVHTVSNQNLLNGSVAKYI